MPKNHQTLVLNLDYRPMGVIDWRRAMVCHFINLENSQKGLKVIEYYKDDVIRSQKQSYQIPAVVWSPIYIKPRKKTVPFSRKNVFIRDQLTCQYCGKQGVPNELEYDHVVPRSKWNEKWGTPTNYTNIVCCCRPCNRLKADRSLKECGFKLLREPKDPNSSNFVLGVTPWNKNIPAQWLPYLPPLYLAIYDRFNKGEKKK